MCVCVRVHLCVAIAMWSLQKTNVVYQFKCLLGDCISENNNIYAGLTSTTLSRRLTMHLSDTSSIAQHLKIHSWPKTEFQKILSENTTILEQQNNKQNYRFSKRSTSERNYLNSIESISNPEQMYLNVFRYCCCLENQIKKINAPSTHQYK